MTNRTVDKMAIVLGLFATGNLLNAAWMLAAPLGWYQHLPGQVPDFGPYNEHLVRDVGCINMTFALAVGLAVFRRDWRAPLVGVAAVFSGLHALLHAFDTARGYVSAQHWMLDLPGVYGPTILLVGLAVWLLRHPASA